MRRMSKSGVKVVDKLSKRLGICLWVVKKFVRCLFGVVESWCLGFLLWGKSGKIYTKNLLNYLWVEVSFPGFAQIPITTIYLKRGYK